MTIQVNTIQARLFKENAVGIQKNNAPDTNFKSRLGWSLEELQEFRTDFAAWNKNRRTTFIASLVLGGLSALSFVLGSFVNDDAKIANSLSKIVGTAFALSSGVGLLIANFGLKRPKLQDY